LCIGEAGAGKSTFLEAYTKDIADDRDYRVYLKEIGGSIVTFHELSNAEELYLSQSYDGVLFFVDLVNNWRVEEAILRWL
jgi:GTPase SAR1 family protein